MAVTNLSAIHPVPKTPQRRLGALRGSGVRARGKAAGMLFTLGS
jgi:hypothetical protein